ncbi:MAG: hypothetical protein AAF382_10095 [Pseudomonadota bacterium]
MAIPNRVTIACPACAATQDVTIADSSVGPRGRVSKTPIYSMAPSPLWTRSRRDGEVYLSCNTCGAQNFTTLSIAAKGPRARRNAS